MFPLCCASESWLTTQTTVDAITSNPAQVATHLSLSALSAFEAMHDRYPVPGSESDLALMKQWVSAKLLSVGWVDTSDNVTDETVVDLAATGPEILKFGQYVDNALGEV